MSSNRALRVILAVILLFLLLGFLPVWGWSHSWGYFPSGLVGFLLLLVVVWIVLGAV